MRKLLEIDVSITGVIIRSLALLADQFAVKA